MTLVARYTDVAGLVYSGFSCEPTLTTELLIETLVSIVDDLNEREVA